MGNETNASKVFDFGKCQVIKHSGTDLVDCLSPEQAHLCGYSLHFGNGYFCKHPLRDEIIKNMKKLQSDSNFTSDVSQSGNQE